jgi:hypothetical protein
MMTICYYWHRLVYGPNPIQKVLKTELPYYQSRFSTTLSLFFWDVLYFIMHTSSCVIVFLWIYKKQKSNNNNRTNRKRSYNIIFMGVIFYVVVVDEE